MTAHMASVKVISIGQQKVCRQRISLTAKMPPDPNFGLRNDADAQLATAFQQLVRDSHLLVQLQIVRHLLVRLGIEVHSCDRVGEPSEAAHHGPLGNQLDRQAAQELVDAARRVGASGRVRLEGDHDGAVLGRLGDEEAAHELLLAVGIVVARDGLRPRLPGDQGRAIRQGRDRAAARKDGLVHFARHLDVAVVKHLRREQTRQQRLALQNPNEHVQQVLRASAEIGRIL
eukprot:2612722-Pleurochrysis_carterae.AAC.3